MTVTVKCVQSPMTSRLSNSRYMLSECDSCTCDTSQWQWSRYEFRRHLQVFLKQIRNVILDQLMILDHSDDIPGIPMSQGLLKTTQNPGNIRTSTGKGWVGSTSCHLYIASG